MLTKDQKQAYLDNSLVCPKCGGNIVAGKPELEDDAVFVPTACQDCGTDYDEIYTLADVTEVE